MKIGIIGVQSKHAEFFGEIINRKNRFSGVRATHIFPVDEPERLDYVIGRTDIENVCGSAEELIEAVDAVLVVPRFRDMHYDFARASIEAGKPVFIDKPFLPSVEQARSLIALSRERGVPIAGGSTFCFLPEIPHWRALMANADSVTLRYRADPDSPFGGYSFYGSHVTDLACALFRGSKRVYARRTGPLVTSLVEYDDRQVILQTDADHHVAEAVYPSGEGMCVLRVNEAPCYACGLDVFMRAIETRQSMEDIERLTESVALLNAILKSLDSGKAENVKY